MDYKNNLVRRQLIKKAVIPVAGQGTRLLPITKTQPKEMLPLFSSRQNGELLLKPIIQLIFEQALLQKLKAMDSNILDAIRKDKSLSDETEKSLKDMLEQLIKNFV